MTNSYDFIHYNAEKKTNSFVKRFEASQFRRIMNANDMNDTFNSDSEENENQKKSKKKTIKKNQIQKRNDMKNIL